MAAADEIKINQSESPGRRLLGHTNLVQSLAFIIRETG